MTDTDLLVASAEAMGYATKIVQDRGRTVVYAQRQPEDCKADWFEWNPLTGLAADAQAMALVKKLYLDIGWVRYNAGGGIWQVGMWDTPNIEWHYCENADLNRAIVECCAKLEANQQGEQE